MRIRKVCVCVYIYIYIYIYIYDNAFIVNFHKGRLVST